MKYNSCSKSVISTTDFDHKHTSTYRLPASIFTLDISAQIIIQFTKN